MMRTKQWSIQESRYQYPYHYIPHLDKNGYASIMRTLRWGYEYLCYQHHIVGIVDSIKPNSILDVGCGDGYFLSILKDRPYEKIGIDLSKKAIAMARAMTPEVEYICSNVSGLDNEYDVVTAIEVLEHIPDNLEGLFLKSIFSKTKKNGFTIISVPTTVAPLNPKHFRHYNIDMIKNKLKEANTSYKLIKYEYIFNNNFLYRKYLQFTQNRIWVFEPHIVRRLMWKYIWKYLRFADKKTGSHLIVLLKKL
jgi:2-polyprenyl-3-methyl-5-hydroxy-6-metoxy-1,4-benzoquinol methylase